MKRFIYYLSILFLASNCIYNEKKALLTQLEFQLEKNPDSVVRQLEQIPVSTFKDFESQARYALLYTKARYQNNLPTHSDSLMKIAWSYYEDSKNEEKAAEANYYLGRIYSEEDSSKKAICFLVNAEQLALKTQNNRLLGKIYNELGNLHSRDYVVTEALEHYHKAQYHSTLANDSVNENYATGNLAKCFLHLNQPDSAWQLYVKAQNKAANRKDKAYQNHLQDYFSNFYTCREEQPPFPTIYPYTPLSFPENTERNATNPDNRQPLYTTSETDRSCADMYFCSLKYEVLAASQQKIDSKDYIFRLEDKYRNEHLKNRNNILEINNYHKTITLIVLIFFVIILILLTLLIHTRHRRIMKEKTNTIQEYMALIEALKEKQQNSPNSLMEKLGENNTKEKALKTALGKRLDIIKYLTDLSFKYGDTPKTNEIFCRKVKELMNVNTLTQNILTDLLEIVNLNYYGIISFLQKNYYLTKEELELCSFICSGFTPQEMSVLYNITVNNIYLRCSRLGKKMGLQQPLSTFLKQTLRELAESFPQTCKPNSKT